MSSSWKGEGYASSGLFGWSGYTWERMTARCQVTGVHCLGNQIFNNDDTDIDKVLERKKIFSREFGES